MTRQILLAPSTATPCQAYTGEVNPSSRTALLPTQLNSGPHRNVSKASLFLAACTKQRSEAVLSIIRCTLVGLVLWPHSVGVPFSVPFPSFDCC